MKRYLRKALQFLLPSLLAWQHRRSVMRKRTSAGFTALWNEVYAATLASLSQTADLELAEKLAQQAFDAEMKRKENLEAKAATFVPAPTVATVITAASAVLAWKGPVDWPTALLTSLYLLALIHLTFSSYFAVAARAEDPFVVPNAVNAVILSKASELERVSFLLASAKMNEPLLVIKVNHLALAQIFFVRGLFMVVTVVLVIAFRWAF